MGNNKSAMICLVYSNCMELFMEMFERCLIGCFCNYEAVDYVSQDVVDILS